jgi:hypothetical protein
MGRYLCLWEIHRAAIPTTGEEWTEWERLLGWVNDEMQTGFLKDWGQFIGELNGYTVVEGTDADVSRMAQQLISVCSFKIHPIASVGQVAEMVRAITGSM